MRGRGGGGGLYHLMFCNFDVFLSFCLVKVLSSVF